MLDKIAARWHQSAWTPEMTLEQAAIDIGYLLGVIHALQEEVGPQSLPSGRPIGSLK